MQVKVSEKEVEEKNNSSTKTSLSGQSSSRTSEPFGLQYSSCYPLRNMSPSLEWKDFHVGACSYLHVLEESAYFFLLAQRYLEFSLFSRIIHPPSRGSYCWKCQRQVHSYVTRPPKPDSLQVTRSGFVYDCLLSAHDIWLCKRWHCVSFELFCENINMLW